MTPTIKLTLDDNKVICKKDNQIRWSLNIDNIKFIGEYTTSAGPFANDWFFIFAETVDQWWQAPTLAVDHEQFWKRLGEELNCEVAPGLFASTSWATRVIYPKALEGQELFRIVKTEVKPKTFWQKLFSKNDNDERLELTDDVRLLFE